MPEQLTFTWPAGVSLSAGDFFVSSANETAFAMVTSPESWPEGKLALTGPAGCGKSHLARVFAAQTGAAVIAARDLTEAMQHPELGIVIEDIEGLKEEGETILFHLHNHLRQAGLPLLVTAKSPPAQWAVALPDLASRMQAMTPAQIADPDDELLTAVIMKLLGDRQIMPTPKLPAYLATRIERSFRAAAEVVDELDAAALRDKRAVNETLARHVLAKRNAP